MKLCKLFLAATAAMAMLATSCTNNSETSKPAVEEGDAVLKISLKGDTYGRAAGSPSTTQEDAVKNFTVYVFNAENDALEATAEFTNQTEGIVSGLSTGFPKRIVVLTNVPSTFPEFEEGDDYEKFKEVSAGITLGSQSTANINANGLLMYGEKSPVTLNLTGITSVPVTVKRLAARVKLGTITVIPTGDYINNLNLFKVTGVTIQRAYSATNIFGEKISSTTLYGGLNNGSMSLVAQPYLKDDLNLTFTAGQSITPGNYFYVLPNYEDYDECTLLTLISEYDGDEQYFPIRINSETGDQNTDGMLLQPNYSYTINIKINHLGEGTTDPDVPPTEASIEVEVDVAPWDMEIVQNVIW